jgi:small subunit ribosomal protein S6
MAYYESVFIARQEVSVQQADALADTFAGVIEENGGQVTKRENWGLKTLAYRIKKNRKGHYLMFNIDGPAAAVQEMERLMGLNEDILRVLTIKVDELEEAPSAQMQNRSREGRYEDSDRPRRDDRPKSDDDGKGAPAPAAGTEDGAKPEAEAAAPEAEATVPEAEAAAPEAEATAPEAEAAAPDAEATAPEAEATAPEAEAAAPDAEATAPEAEATAPEAEAAAPEAEATAPEAEAAAPDAEATAPEGDEK